MPVSPVLHHASVTSSAPCHCHQFRTMPVSPVPHHASVMSGGLVMHRFNDLIMMFIIVDALHQTLKSQPTAHPFA